MKETKDVVACVVDHGQFVYVARRLARDFKQVYYTCDYESGYPSTRQGAIGDGFGDIERVDSLWQVKKSCDLFVFPDIGFANEQNELIAQGFPVWGTHGIDWMETERGLFLEQLGDLKMEVPPYRSIKGTTALREYFKDAEDVYVKISRWRGDWETFHWRSWDQDEIELIARELKVGKIKDEITFYVFDALDIEVEDGVDTWCIDGEWPSVVMHGMEKKDKFFIGTFQEFDDVPDEVREVNEKLSEFFQTFGYRGAFSSEVCITKDKTPYFTDPTCRFGSPPSQIQMEMIDNWGDVVWAGANGVCVDPVQVAKFGVQGIVQVGSDPVTVRESCVDISPDVEQWLKCSYCYGAGKTTVFPVQPEDSCRAWLIGIGDTIQGAIDHFTSNLAGLPDGATCSLDGLPDLLDEIRTAERMGMTFTDQPVPSPEDVHA